jgi:dolichyl-diphosphooligosaccharide--protein glycosyltransferase
MSLRTESDEEVGTSVLDMVEEWYTVPALLALVATMLWIRLQSYDNYIRDGEVLFSGNDAWYHLREVQYTVRNWPATMPFDPWTYFPYGTSVGQFGTLYDQLVATAALIVGLGSPTDFQIAQTLLVAPAVFGAATAIPVYVMGKRLAGRLPGLFGAVVLALLPGLFLQRTLVGVADHNGVEPFFQVLGVLGVLVAIQVAERDLPIWELVVDRDVEALRAPTLWAALAGVAVAAYMWVWPPGVLLVGIIGVFTLVKVATDVRRGDTPEPIVYAIAVAMSVTAVLMLIPLQTLEFSVSEFSFLQPLFSFGVAAGAVFLAWLAREWDARDLDPDLFPVAVLGIVGAGVVGVAVVLPSVYDLVAGNILRILGFSAGAQTRTIGEAQPYLDPDNLRRLGFIDSNQNPNRIGRILADYGFTLFTAIAAAIWMLAKPLYDEGGPYHYAYITGGLAVIGLLFLFPGLPGALGGAIGLNDQLFGLVVVAAIAIGAVMYADVETEHLMVLTWGGFITAAAFTQLRFHYYLAPVVAVLNAYLLGVALHYLDFDSIEAAVTDIEPYQVMSILMVVLVITMPVLVVPLNVRAGSGASAASSTAWQAADNRGPGNIVNWDGNLQWMAENTPQEGQLGVGPDGGEAMAYYGSYDRQDNFDYPDGAYGVMSWWDYGHWITVRGERIPNANPFQQGATQAANYLLAPNETAGEETLRTLDRDSDEGDQTRYVMVDWQMATPGSKFGAPIVFYDRSNVSSGDFYERMFGADSFQNSFLLRNQRYYDSMMVRLYEYHGSAMRPAPVVVDYDERQVTDPQTGDRFTVKTATTTGETLRTFENMTAARQYAEQDGTAKVGGIGPFPEERVPALQHYRLVKASESSALNVGGYVRTLRSTMRTTNLSNFRALYRTEPAFVKTFERVPGATVEGSGAPPNATIRASAEFRVPASNSTFTYRQQTTADENGEFTMTLPYSTTGYDEYGPENGYTNVSVRATTDHYVIQGPQSFNGSHIVRYSSNLTVPEGAVNGAEDGRIEMELGRESRELDLNQNVTVGGSSEGGAESGSDAGSDSGSGGSESVHPSDGLTGDRGAGGPPAASEAKPASAVRQAPAVAPAH